MLRGTVDERENNEKTKEDVLGRYDPGDSEGEGFSSPPRKIRRGAAED